MKRFLWCPEEGMKKCTAFFPFRHAHIIIRSPEAEIKHPPCKGMAIYLAFWDLDPDTINRQGVFRENPVRQKELLDGCMQTSHAASIVTFVKSVPDDVPIIVNCEAGVSRSPGTVLALRRYYGGDEEEVFKKAIPNLHVTSTLTSVLKSMGGR